MTRSPAAFAPTLQLENADAGWDVPELLEGTPSLITSDPSLAIPGADMVLLAGLPVHLNRALLLSILPHLPADGRLVLVGSVCCYGHFSALLSSLLPPGANASPFGTALIPFCCSTPAYGRRGRVIGAKRLLRVATPGGRDPHGVKKILGPVLRTRLEDVSFLASTLWPNNASLHPPIL
ncbi:hypothetical protein TeGR_g10297 [Tetraparma gracilis]|uniref:Uncharacterized protein n=1 Tax=Tetraparma gracilis TaxID=2962635 RepID=A0ABQ6NCG9_9STRA|nr:hypothetical protein TeGR_g10297 [Tetraparma gracilis]